MSRHKHMQQVDAPEGMGLGEFRNHFSAQFAEATGKEGAKLEKMADDIHVPAGTNRVCLHLSGTPNKTQASLLATYAPR